MKMDRDNKEYILFYDSGIGGLSTLTETLKIVNGENFIYFADDRNCPYGNKSKKEIIEIVESNILRLVELYKIKIIVIACNTATACVVADLRLKLAKVIIGTEPAIAPAMKSSKSKHVLVLATDATLSQEKFIKLKYSQAGEIESLKMKDLAEKIVNHFINAAPLDIDDEISDIARCIDKYNEIDAIVLGCTHYSLIKDKIKCFIKEKKKQLNFEIFDGNIGVAKRVKSFLKRCDVKEVNEIKIILSSGDLKKKNKYDQLLKMLVNCNKRIKIKKNS